MTAGTPLHCVAAASFRSRNDNVSLNHSAGTFVPSPPPPRPPPHHLRCPHHPHLLSLSLVFRGDFSRAESQAEEWRGMNTGGGGQAAAAAGTCVLSRKVVRRRSLKKRKEKKEKTHSFPIATVAAAAERRAVKRETRLTS